ncbi:N-ethylmaleimide sensitive fusion protein [Pelomyxa schiedti]|nr:N-ethylmaleimide sensitive fusion protein [Pelomyxa schiedti]
MSPSPPKKSELLTPSTTTASPARVETVNPDGSKILGVEVGRAILSRCTIIEIKRAATSTMKVTDSSRLPSFLNRDILTLISTTPGNRIEFKRNILDACALGIGGLEREFNEIFRRAFVPRLFGSHFMTKSLGQKHVKGIILYGPPGTGKTLIARQIGKMFNGKEPIVKSGPEMLNKYVGKSEENIRELFAEAEADFERNGDDAELHVIVIDELDSICRARGSGATGGTNVGDSIVNQLLAKLDGVNQLNNILLIGMTNRLDLIDEALTRPGRLEVKIEIGLPDEPGRLQILRIHTGLMKSEGYLSPDVDLNDLAKRTKNWSGAELEGIVRNACTYAMDEHVDPQNLSAPLDPRTVAVKKDHFEASMKQIKPAFGVAEDEFERCAPNGIIDYGPACRAVLETGKLLVEQLVEENTQTPLISLLLRGSAGSGKTALATQIARNSGFSYIKLLSAENQAGYPESIKCARIHKVFEDSYRTPFSVIVIDDFERLIEYTSIGPRFSNTLLQLLLVLVRKQPPQGRRLLVVGTITTSGGVMDDLGAMLHDAWDAVVDVPCVTGPGELAAALLALRPDLTPDMRDAVCGGCGGGCQVPMKKLIHECGRAKRLSASGAVGPVEAMCERLTPFRAAAATTSPASTTTNTPPAQEDRKL